MTLIETALIAELAELCEHDARLVWSGRRRGCPTRCSALELAMKTTANNPGLVLNLCVNYGGQAEIADAAQGIARRVQAGELAVDDIGPETVGQHLYVPGLPPVDLLIRPGGDLRVSNFLLWQIAYAEFYVMQEYWPAFQPEHLDAAIADYQRRQRVLADWCWTSRMWAPTGQVTRYGGDRNMHIRWMAVMVVAL